MMERRETLPVGGMCAEIAVGILIRVITIADTAERRCYGMIDQEKVIQRQNVIAALYACTSSEDKSQKCYVCPYFCGPDNCCQEMMWDALTLLEEQEIIGHWEEPEDEGIVSFHPAAYSQCSVCKRKSYFGHKDRFCRHCGARMEVKEEAP